MSFYSILSIRRFRLILTILPLMLIFGLHIRNFRWHYTSMQARQIAITDSKISQLQIANQNISRTLVIGYQNSEDISWIHRKLPSINTALYSVDDPRAILHTKLNKGHEAMVYLSYIIDHYNNLPDVVLFFHAHEKTWHNNILLDNDSPKTILRLDPQQVLKDGYVNTRCQWEPGCPGALHIDRPVSELDHVKRPEEIFLTSKLWRELHQVDTVPKTIGQPCCAQFAASREAILARPISSYLHYRDWLEMTTLLDKISGRLFEHSWQFIFRGIPEYCPSELDCLYRNYGILFDSQEDVDDYKDKWRKKEGWWFRFWQDTASLERELGRRKIEAYKRGNAKKQAEFASRSGGVRKA
jgi:hypothetical protein